MTQKNEFPPFLDKENKEHNNKIIKRTCYASYRYVDNEVDNDNFRLLVRSIMSGLIIAIIVVILILTFK